MFCERRDANCNRLCTARRSDLASCDGAAGFDDREEFRRMMLMLLEQRGLRTPESGKSSSKRRPCKALGLSPSSRQADHPHGGQVSAPAVSLTDGRDAGGNCPRMPGRSPIIKPCADCTSAHGWCSASARPSCGGKPECRWRPGRQLCLFLGAALIAGNESGRGSVTHRANHVALPSMVQRDQRNHFAPPVLTGSLPLGS